MSDINEITPQPQRGLTFEDVWAAMMETDRRFKETDRRFKETERRFKETERLIDKIGKQIGDVHNKFGKMAEHMVAPSISRRFNELGFHFDAIATNGQKILDEQGRILAEIDLLLENGDYIIAVEVKVEPKEADISHHLKRLEILRVRMDRRGDRRKIRGAIAGAIYDKAVKEAVIEAGMYVVAQSGDTMKVEIPEDFKPRDWEAALSV
ncbi:MAG: hypothetical protein LBG57_13910 [Treponema sp.]|jgi:predicted AAA+ superfamily ATPase|nr:hypothetical protein [Treponema sp.]